MKQSIGYTVTLNLVSVFLSIIFVFLASAVIYFKSNKVSNVITSSIEKYEGFNSKSINEINLKINSLGYNIRKINCSSTVSDKQAINKVCNLNADTSSRGYCVYECLLPDNYYYYKVRTNMLINIPIINELLNIPIYSNTNTMYNFGR